MKFTNAVKTCMKIRNSISIHIERISREDETEAQIIIGEEEERERLRKILRLRG